MFKELAPVLRHRAVLMTITSTEDDQIRVNVVPKKLKDDENKALTTPLTVTGAAEELDAELGQTLVDFVGSHLQLKNTLVQVSRCTSNAGKCALGSRYCTQFPEFAELFVLKSRTESDARKKDSVIFVLISRTNFSRKFGVDLGTTVTLSSFIAWDSSGIYIPGFKCSATVGQTLDEFLLAVRTLGWRLLQLEDTGKLDGSTPIR
jgi:PRTRC genetic system protein E